MLHNPRTWEVFGFDCRLIDTKYRIIYANLCSVTGFCPFILFSISQHSGTERAFTGREDESMNADRSVNIILLNLMVVLSFFIICVLVPLNTLCADQYGPKPHRFYFGLFLAGFSWEERIVEFNDGRTVDLQNDAGFGGSIGFKPHRNLLIRFDLAYFSRLIGHSYMNGRKLGTLTKHTGNGHFTLSLLLNLTSGPVVPYVGGGAGWIEVPSDEGVSFSLNPMIQGGISYYVNKNVAISIDIKHLRGSLDDTVDDAVGAWTYYAGVHTLVPPIRE